MTVSVSVRTFGALGNGTTDDTAAIQAAITCAVALGGSVVEFPPGRYRITSALDIGTGPVILRGSGWVSNVQAAFGHADWLSTVFTHGTVLYADGCSAINVTSATARKLIIEDLCILGKGVGGHIGIGSTTGSLVGMSLRNVGVLNFATGISYSSAVDDEAFSLTVRGCTTGITFGSAADIRFYGVDIQSNTTGISIPEGASIRFWGGVVQANGTGLSIAPTAAGGVADITLSGLWFEANTVAPISLVTTTQPLQRVTFEWCRCSDSFTLTPVAGSTLTQLCFLGCDFAGITLHLDSGVTCVSNINSRFAAVVHDGDENYVTIGDSSRQTKWADQVVSTTTPGAAYTPDWSAGSKYYLTLDDNIAISVPTNGIYYAEVEFIIRQPAAGGKTVTWGAGYHASWSDAGNVANAYSSITFRCIPGGQWIQIGAQKAYGL